MKQTITPDKKKKEQNRNWTKSKILKKKEESRNEKIAAALLDNKNIEILQNEEEGVIETEGMERSDRISQNRLKTEVDVNTASKIYSLTLDQFGPYTVNFDRAGRHLLLAGEKGHIAMMDALEQSLMNEFHVDDSINDIQFLHDYGMFATAQKKCVHIYDSDGIELHCMREIAFPKYLEFLPYHYLLVSCCNGGRIHYLDVSTGEMVCWKETKRGTATSFTQNPYNAVMLHGDYRGCITMWSPNQSEALVTMMCHKSSVLDMAVDLSGHYLVTSGSDSQVKIWDVRTYQELYDYHTPTPVQHLCLSQTNMLGMSIGGTVQIWKNVFKQKMVYPYMKENIGGHKVQSIAFRPFEDQLLLGYNNGIQSMVIPGCGEANIDSFEMNPYESKKQRRERNVQKLLEKLKPDQIVLDPDSLF